MNTINNDTSECKIAIHTVPSITRAGFVCRKWPIYQVVVGANPFGPRGGTGGRWVSGKVVAEFRTKAKALEFVNEYQL